MNWNLCRFQPVDVLVNADARGMEGSWGYQGEIFPTAFAGALRTYILRRANYDFRKAWDVQDETAKSVSIAVGMQPSDDEMLFRFAGPISTHLDGSLLFPIPRHILQGEGRRGRIRAVTLRPSRERVLCDSPFGNLSILSSPERESENDARLITLKHLLALFLSNAGPLAGSAADFYRSVSRPSAKFPSTDLHVSERRHGHERNSRGTVKDENLFSRSVSRMAEDCPLNAIRQAGFAGLYHDESLLPTGIVDTLRLGGDGHLAELRTESATELKQLLKDFQQIVLDQLERSRGLAVYLVTPAIFDAGWRPSQRKTPGLSLKAAAVGRPRIVAGWDYTRKTVRGKGGPRPVRRAAPPGSVYFYEVEDLDQAIAFVSKFSFAESISDELARLGYGLMLACPWQVKQ